MMSTGGCNLSICNAYICRIVHGQPYESDINSSCRVKIGDDRMEKLSEITRRDIIDLLYSGMQTKEFSYLGRCDEVSFFSRLYNLSNLASTDSRFKNADGDIWQHTINNDDWDWDWFYYYYNAAFNLQTNDEKFLEFLCQVFHPVVRVEDSEWEKYLSEINGLIKFDGYRIVQSTSISGRAVYGVIKVKNDELINEYSSKLKNEFNTDYINSQISVMIEMIDRNPNFAIGKAKELLESCAKTILDDLNEEYDPKTEFMPLMKKTFNILGLDVKSQENEVAKKILGSLASTTHHMSELRNAFGDGHGKSKNFSSLPPRYARLAVGTSTTAVNFIWETYLERKF